MATAVAFLIANAVTIVSVASLAFAAYSFYQASQFETPGGESGGDQTVMVQQADIKRRFVLGITRLGMIVFERAKPTPESDVLHFAGLFCQGPSTIEWLYFGEELLALEVTGQDSNGVDIWEPKETPIFLVETRWMGTSKLTEVADEAAMDAVGSLYLTEPVMRKFKVDSSKFRGLMQVRKYDGTQTTADAMMVDELDHWTTSHKLLGLTYATLRLVRNREVFTNGVENISARIKGIEVLDPRDDSTGWTQNPALLWYWWKTNEIFGRGIPSTDIDLEAVKDTADISDESTATVYGGTEPLYSCHGVFDTGMEPEVFEKDLKATIDGYVANLGGMETLIPGRYVAPTFTLKPEHVTGRLTNKTRLPRREQVEVVKGTYFAPDNSWKRTTFPAAKLSSDAVTDEKVVNLELRLVSSPSQAQRLARRFLKRGVLERRMEGTFDPETIRAISGQPIQIELGERFGLSGKPAVVLGWGLNVEQNGEMNVKMNLRETSPDIDVFDPLTDEKPVTVGTRTAEDAAQVSIPVSDPVGGTLVGVSFPLTVSISTPTNGATLRWSRGLNINSVSDGTAYSGAISVEENEVIIAKAFKDGFEDSSAMVAIFSQAMVAVPRPSLAAGEYSDGYFPDDVTLTSETPGATIRYSLSGDITTETDGSAYSGPITIPADGGTLRARAFKTGWTKSDQTTTVYTEA